MYHFYRFDRSAHLWASGQPLTATHRCSEPAEWTSLWRKRMSLGTTRETWSKVRERRHKPHPFDNKACLCVCVCVWSNDKPWTKKVHTVCRNNAFLCLYRGICLGRVLFGDSPPSSSGSVSVQMLNISLVCFNLLTIKTGVPKHYFRSM